jgi:hypothetical protein
MISLSHTLDTRWCMIASKLRQAWVFLLHSDGGCCFSKAGVPFVIDIRDSPSKSPSYGQRFSSILSFTNSDNPRATCVAKGPEYLSRSRKKVPVGGGNELECEVHTGQMGGKPDSEKVFPLDKAPGQSDRFGVGE